MSVEIDASEMTGTASFEITPIDNATYNGNQEVTIDLAATSDLVLRDLAKVTSWSMTKNSRPSPFRRILKKWLKAAAPSA